MLISLELFVMLVLANGALVNGTLLSGTRFDEIAAGSVHRCEGPFDKKNVVEMNVPIGKGCHPSNADVNVSNLTEMC